MESCSLHPVQLRPAGWSSICLWLWLRIKAGDGPPQLATAPSPVTARSLTVWGRKMVKLAAASVELAFAKSSSLHSAELSFELRQRKGMHQSLCWSVQAVYQSLVH